MRKFLTTLIFFRSFLFSQNTFDNIVSMCADDDYLYVVQKNSPYHEGNGDAVLKLDPDERAESITDCMTFITVPSKAADIEATLVDGAHGPRELYLFVLK